MTKTFSLRNIAGTALTMALMVSAIAFAPITASADSDKDKSLRSASRPEIVITEGGKALVRGAKVTAVNGASITAQANFGTGVTNWVVLTDSATTFYDARGNKGSLASITVNDSISFAGTIDGTSIFNIKAAAVKDWSPVASEASVKGTISSLNVSGLSFVLTKRSDDATRTITVNLSGATTISLNGAVSALGSLAVSDGIKVTGTLSADGTVMTATKVEASRPAEQEDKRFSKMMKQWFNGKAFFKFGE